MRLLPLFATRAVMTGATPTASTRDVLPVRNASAATVQRNQVVRVSFCVTVL